MSRIRRSITATLLSATAAAGIWAVALPASATSAATAGTAALSAGTTASSTSTASTASTAVTNPSGIVTQGNDWWW